MEELLAHEVVDLVVLDLTLRAEDGMALARRLRDQSAIPLIMLTGRCEEADRVMGLELGADDYLTKPFSPRELLARIRAVLRRRRPEVQQGRPEGIRAYRFDGWELNLNTRRLKSRDGRNVSLSNGEFSLLIVFLGAPHRILSRDQLIDMSRLHSDEIYNRTVNTQVMRLRGKLETDPAKPRYLLTERGAGTCSASRSIPSTDRRPPSFHRRQVELRRFIHGSATSRTRPPPQTAARRVCRTRIEFAHNSL
jgi:DNA-binding response OmpR family regulator